MCTLVYRKDRRRREEKKKRASFYFLFSSFHLLLHETGFTLISPYLLSLSIFHFSLYISQLSLFPFSCFFLKKKIWLYLPFLCLVLFSVFFYLHNLIYLLLFLELKRRKPHTNSHLRYARISFSLILAVAGKAKFLIFCHFSSSLKHLSFLIKDKLH